MSPSESSTQGDADMGPSHETDPEALPKGGDSGFSGSIEYADGLVAGSPMSSTGSETSTGSVDRVAANDPKVCHLSSLEPGLRDLEHSWLGHAYGILIFVHHLRRWT